MFITNYLIMNTNIDLPQELLYKEGNIWINGKNGQLRYNSKDDATSQWLNPLSTYPFPLNHAL